MSDNLSINIYKDDGHCYACQAINYKSSLSLPHNVVDKLYQIYMKDIFGLNVLLCENCLNELKDKIMRIQLK